MAIKDVAKQTNVGNEQRVRVLIVEERPADVQAILQSLRDYPLQEFEVDQAGTPGRAIERLAMSSFDVVFLDWAACRDIKDCERLLRAAGDAPVILLADADNESLEAEAIRSGIQDYIVKDDRYCKRIVRVARSAAEHRRIKIDLEKANERLKEQAEELQAKGEELRLHVEELAGSEHRFHDAFNHAPIGMVLTDLQGHFLRANRAYCRMVGYEEWELLEPDFNFQRLTCSDDAGGNLDEMKRLLAGEIPALFVEKRYIRRDGKIVWVRVSASLRCDANGRPAQIVGLVEDITDRRQAEDVLRRSEERYRTLFEDDLTGNFVATPDSEILLCNPAFARIYGFSAPQDAVGLRLVDLKVEPKNWGALLGRLKRYRIVERFESDHRRRDGATISIVENVVGIFDAHGELTQVQGYVFDITERRQAEEMLRQSEERFRLAVKATRDAIWDLDMRSGTMRWNEVYTTLYGRPSATTDSWQWWIDHIHPEDRERALGGLRASINGGKSTWICEYRFKRIDGAWAQIFDRAYIARDTSGQAWRVIGAMQDLTERKRAEEIIAASEKKYRELIETADCIILRWDNQGAIRFINARGANMLGYEPYELLGRHLTTIVPQVESTGRDLSSLIEDILERPKQYVYNPHENIRKDGTRIWIAWANKAITDEQRNVEEVLAIGNDISALKEAERRLQELNVTLENRVAERTADLEQRTRQLQKLSLELSQTENRERKRMAEILHDDLQQQLVAMGFHLKLLAKGAQHDAKKAVIISELDQMVKDAVEKSRSLSHELSPATLYRDDLGQSFDWLAGHMYARHGLVCRVLIHGKVCVQSDALKVFIYKACQELLFNVVKHAGASDTVIRLRRFHRYICLSVADRGPGLDPQRLQEADGFGLFSIRERVELLGGRMRITSAPGKGSTFRLLVPAEPPTADRPPHGHQRIQAV